jgi:CRP/FNR family cyclic AMP-dependent transcriptional regulator
MKPYPYLASQPIALDRLLSYCHRRRFPAKADIVHPGDPADTLYYLLEGSVSIVIVDEEGNELVLAYLNEHEFIGELGLFSPPQTERGVTVRARVACQVAEISYTRLQQVMDGPLAAFQAELLTAFGMQLARRLLQASRKVGDLAFLDVTGRIAKTLLDLTKEPDAITHPDGMQIRVTRQELGRLIGCSREMAGRVLKNLEAQGLIRASGKTIVVFGTR